MRRTLSCPKCGARRIWCLERVAAQDSSVGLGGSYYLKLVAGGTTVATGYFDAYVCASCEYAEFWAHGVSELVEDPSRGVRLLTGSDSEGPEEIAQSIEQAREEEERAEAYRLQGELAAVERALHARPWIRLLAGPTFGAIGAAVLDWAFDLKTRVLLGLGIGFTFTMLFWTGHTTNQAQRRQKAEALRSRIAKLARSETPRRLPYR